MILLADSFGKGAEAKQLLLEKTYEEGSNVSNVAVLSSVADELGLSKASDYLVSRVQNSRPARFRVFMMQRLLLLQLFCF